MATGDCLFCAVAAGSEPSHVVLDEPDVLAFLDHRPVFKGHVLVIPRLHVVTLPDLPTDLLEPVFSELREMYGRQADLPAGIQIAFTVEPGCPKVSADAGQLRQVITNLVNNALDAVRHVGMPKVEAHLPAPLTQACDAMLVLEHLRDPFVRGQGAITPQIVAAVDHAYRTCLRHTETIVST